MNDKELCEACEKREATEIDAGDTPLCRECLLEGEKEFLENEVSDLREKLADAYKELSGKYLHSSQCATSIAPAQTPGKCDCDGKEGGR